MKINISTHGLTLTEALESHVQDKLSKAAEHYPEVISAQVILRQETKTSFNCELDDNYYLPKKDRYLTSLYSM